MKSKNKKTKRTQIETKENERFSKIDENDEECLSKKPKADIVSYENYVDYAFHYMIMADPVFTSDGFTFEKECIENWLKVHETNPRTNSTLANKILIPNVDLKRNISEFLDKNSFLYERDEVYLPKEVFMEFFKDISDNNLINLKGKWLKYPDKRVFFKKFELHLNDIHSDYSIFYYASQYGTCDSTEIILDYLILNNLTEKIVNQIPKDWKPFYLPKLIQNYMNCNYELLLTKLKFLFSFNEYIKKIDKNYLIKIIKSLIDDENLDKLKKILDIFENLVFEKDQNGNTLLLLAVKHDKMSLITYLIESTNSNKNELNSNNENCLYFSIKNKNTSVIKLFFGKNAVKTPYLHLALQLYPFNLKLIEKILDLDENFLNVYDENKKTLLYIACETNNLKCVELLLSRGANASMYCTNNEETILHLSCRKNQKALVKLIIKYECLIDLVDSNEENCLHIAVQTKNINYEILEMLLNAEIDYFHRNKQDKTPIDLATNEIKEFIFSISSEVKRNKNKLNADLNKTNQNLKKKLKDYINLTNSLRKTNETLQFKNTLLGLNCQNIIITGSNDILLWDLDTGKCIKEIKGHEDSIDAFKILPNGCLMSSSRDRTIKRWDLVTEKCLATINEAHSDIIFNLELTKEGNLISCSVDKTIKFWDIEKNICLKSIKEYGRVFSMLYMKENDHLICGLGKSGNIDVWNITNSDYIGAFIGHTDIIRCLKLLKNKNLVSCGDDKTIKLWNTTNGELIKTLIGHTNSVLNLEIMQNGNLISCSRDKTIKVWDLNRYFCIKTIKCNAKKLKLMKDGNLITSSNGNIKIWDLERGICLNTMPCHASSFELLN